MLTLLAIPNSFMVRLEAELAARSSSSSLTSASFPLSAGSSPPISRPPAVNLTSLNSSSVVLICSPTPFSPFLSPANSNATVLGLIASLPYDVSVFAVDAFLVPYGFDLAASEIRPPSPSASTLRGCSSWRVGSTSLRPCSSAGGEEGRQREGRLMATGVEKVEEEEGGGGQENRGEEGGERRIE